MGFYKPQRRTRRALPPEITPTEDNECMALADYLNARGLLFTHLAQETAAGRPVNGIWVKNRRALARNEAMGVKKGFPDYVVFIPEGKSQTSKPKMLAIEMKREYGGSTSKEQLVWLECLGQVEGIESTVARGFDEARAFIDTHLRI